VKYHLPPTALRELAFAMLLRRRIAYSRHARQVTATLFPPLRILGAENIPQDPRGVITVNHYSAPGFSSLLITTGISAALPAEVFWTITASWTYPGQRLGNLKERLSRILLGGIARVYGFNPMPPMPPRPGEEKERALASRRLLEYARHHPAPLIGLAPEGGDTPGGVLQMPPPGAGRLLLELARQGLQFLPVGVYIEELGHGMPCPYTLCFGVPYHLEIPAGISNADADRLASRAVMTAVAACLPPALRGEFG
jgi:hypothetical protein